MPPGCITASLISVQELCLSRAFVVAMQVAITVLRCADVKEVGTVGFGRC